MNVGFVSLGCSKNLIDTEATIGKFKENNFNIVNDEKWRELLQDEIRNSNWRDVVMEKLCKLVGVKR